jgi:hypothetical protein
MALRYRVQDGDTAHAACRLEMGCRLSCNTRFGREGVQCCREWLPDGFGRMREDVSSAAGSCDDVDGLVLVVVMS